MFDFVSLFAEFDFCLCICHVFFFCFSVCHFIFCLRVYHVCLS